jgi:hypothetical protein
MKLNQIIDVRNWPRRKMNVGYGTRNKVVLKQTNMGKVYFMAKTYTKDIGELRSEVCASTIGRVFGFPVQKTWFCIMPTLKMFLHPVGVLVQLDVRRERYTKRKQFRENLIHGGALIGLVDENFARLKSEKERRKIYKLSLVIQALKNYVRKNKTSKSVWKQFFELLVFDALIGGTDRHYNNWGILEKADDSKFIRLAPAFDNGISLLWKIDEYGPKFQKDILTMRFTKGAESMFKKDGGGKYDLFEVLEAFYLIPELKGSGIAKKIYDRLCSVKVGHLKGTMLKNIPPDKKFRSERKEVLLVYEYAMIRLEMLKNTLIRIDKKYQ